MPTRPAVALAIIIGTSSGLTRVGPFSSYTRDLLLEGAQAADAGAGDDAGPGRVDAGADGAAVAEGRRHGVAGGGDAELGGAVDAGGPP